MATTNIQLQLAGRTITIRPIRITDMDLEAAFVQHLSPQSKHYRFLGGVKELTPKMLKAFCDVDGQHSMAFVATVREDGKEVGVGVSRYAPTVNEDVCEMAVTVADEWQHKGLGTLLAKKIIEFAKAHGVKKLYSMDSAYNSAMRQLAEDLGMTTRRDPDNIHQVIYSLSL